MSRQKDFREMSKDLHVQFLSNPWTIYETGCEDGYQYAKKRLREVLGFELDFNVAEFDDGVTTESLVDKICKRMEE